VLDVATAATAMVVAALRAVRDFLMASPRCQPQRVKNARLAASVPPPSAAQRKTPPRNARGGAPASHVDNRNDPVPTVHDDNLVADDKVHVPAPLGIDLDQGRRYRHHADAGRYDRASAQGKVNVIDPGALRHDRLSYLCALLRRQVDVAALLRLALLPALVLLRPLIPALTGLVLLSVALGRGLSSFASLRLRGLVPLGLALLRLALIPLRWTRLVPLGLALLRLALIPLRWTRLGWTRLRWARLRWARLGWTRLACGTAALTATLLR
jgi:hypothetical protein